MVRREIAEASRMEERRSVDLITFPPSLELITKPFGYADLADEVRDVLDAI
jgi:hypothetical protein